MMCHSEAKRKGNDVIDLMEWSWWTQGNERVVLIMSLTSKCMLI